MDLEKALNIRDAIEEELNVSRHGEFIKERRVGLGLSQEDVSKELEFKSPQFISNVERNICSFPPDKITKLSKILKF